MMKQGFTLIEVVIATFISALITGVLFTSFFQVNQTARIAEQRMNFESKAALFSHYFERDLSGACLVFQPDEKLTPTAQQQPGKPGPQQAKVEPEKKEAVKKIKRIEKIFVYTRQGTRFESLNFITNNALPKFWGAKEVKLTPLIARVTYRLQEDKNLKGAFELVRQEAPELNAEKFSASKPRSYTLVDGIKDLSLKFTAKLVEEIEEKKAEEKQPQKPAPGAAQQQKPSPQQAKGKKIKITFKEVDDWNSDSLEKAQKDAQKEKKKGPVQKLIPISVEVSGSFWDATKKRTMPFNFIVPIIAYAEFKPRPKQQPQIPPPQPQKPGQQGQPGQQGLPGSFFKPGNTTKNASSIGVTQQSDDSEAALKRMFKNMFSSVNQQSVAPAQFSRIPS